MQFIRQGPDIPERLLQAHEEGSVVFFCGAGISYPARLPGFKGLVQKLFVELGETPNCVQQASIKAGQFDTVIGLLEESIVGGRETVRRALASILTPDLSAPNATATHEALLTLGKNREGQTRLITTNFDRLFEEVITKNGMDIDRFLAPLLPVPKSRWGGLVYLHGLLSTSPSAKELDHLVVSSGDFGLAYLTERWASRFVGELFRNFTVCFVGYSINDPVLRYMMDALAADRLRGESPPEMFAFGSYSKGNEVARATEWRAKNVTPVLYREHNHHAYLQKTLRAWADTYRDGARGKERIVMECAMARPLMSTKQDDFVGRMLWALSDPRGVAAKRFADFDPAPSLDWLEPLCEDRYHHRDLSWFGVPPTTLKDAMVDFSMTCRPAPYTHASRMVVVDWGAKGSQWDKVMFHLASWLIRHLDDPALALWLVKRGGQLHEEFSRLIDGRLDELTKFEREGNHDKLEEIRTNSPCAIPRPMMRTIWRLLLTGRVKSRRRELDLYLWLDRLKRDGLTASLRLELRQILAPSVSLREPFRLNVERDGAREPQRLRDIFEWEVVLSMESGHSVLLELSESPQWAGVLPDLLTDFGALLHDSLDLMRELGGADEKSDLSYMHQPSISEHIQNEGFHDWTALIELTRDAWLATAAIDSDRARLTAEVWQHVPYPLFRRLAFFAAAQEGIVSLRSGLEWLLADDSWWLWSVETRREVMRLLVAIAPKLEPSQRAKLEQAVLAGPPRSMFNDEINAESWAHIVEREIWLRLAKMSSVGTVLGVEAKALLNASTVRYPEWQLAVDERDEFPYWTGKGDEGRQFLVTPRRRRELINWLKEHPGTDHWQEDDWRQRCRGNFATTACALWALVKEDIWLTERWREALQAWSEEKLLKPSWRYMAPVLVSAPDAVFLSLEHGVSLWLQTLAKTFDGHESLFLNLCKRILASNHQEDIANDEPVMRAINNPVGQVTEALLRWWYRRSPEDGEGLPSELRLIFTGLCDKQVGRFQHARVVLAAHTIALFRVDPDWTTEQLLPLFDWRLSVAEARAAWKGFLWSPRLYRPLTEALKQPFLDTSHHYDVLGKHCEQYVALLTFSALDPGDMFTKAELANATRSLPPEGVSHAARTLVRALEGAGEQRADYWIHRLAPYLQSIWPRSREHASPMASESLGRLCVAADSAFPEAYEMLRPWLVPLQHPDFLVRRLHKANICQRFPDEALGFLSLIISDQTRLLPMDLGACLDEIQTGAPALRNDVRFTQLIAYLDQHGRQ